MRKRAPIILDQYERFSSIVGQLVDFQFKAIWRVFNPVRYIRVMITMIKNKGTLSDAYAFLYTTQEKQTEFYTIVTSKHPLEGVRQYIRRKCRGYDFARLRELYALMNQQSNRWTAARATAIIAGVASFLLSTVPEPFIEQLGWNYEQYQKIAFLLIAIALVLAAWIFQSYYLSEWKKRSKKELLDRIMNYMKVFERKA